MAGDPAAFSALYERHQQELYRYSRSILGNDEDARDALQNAMMKAFTALQTEQRDLDLRPWLFRIVHNEAISLIRRRPETTELNPQIGGADDTVQQTVETRERLEHLRSDLQDLPPRQRAALVMRELSGLSHAQIATALEISARAVKQTIYEARSGLGDCAEGRAMECETVQRTLSDGDGRIVGNRRLRAHLRSCRSCRQFRAALAQRPKDLAALSPVVPLATIGVLAATKGAVIGGAAVGGGAAATAGTGAGIGGGFVFAGATKLAVTVAATVAVAGGTVAVTRTATHHPAPDAPAPRLTSAASVGGGLGDTASVGRFVPLPGTAAITVAPPKDTANRAAADRRTKSGRPSTTRRRQQRGTAKRAAAAGGRGPQVTNRGRGPSPDAAAPNAVAQAARASRGPTPAVGRKASTPPQSKAAPPASKAARKPAGTPASNNGRAAAKGKAKVAVPPGANRGGPAKTPAGSSPVRD